MAHAVRLSDLQFLTPSEREAVLARLVAEALAPTNGFSVAMLAKIRDFELRYEMTSDELLRRLESGQQPETDEVAEWLFLLQLRERTGGGGESARP